MNAAETIAAAIEKLEAIKRDATWTYHPEIMSLRANGVTVAEGIMPPDGARIEMMHRTVKAQLDILRRGSHAFDCTFVSRAENQAWIAAAQVLARAILGEVQS